MPLLSFRVWLDIDDSTQLDHLRATVLVDGVEQMPYAWGKKPADKYREWQEVDLPLKAAWKGKQVALRLFFSTWAGIWEEGEGIMVDDLALKRRCP
jgi:hypothetical protein